MTREDKAKEEMAWRKINEDIELEREGVEPLLDSYFVYSTEVFHAVGLSGARKMYALGVIALYTSKAWNCMFGKNNSVTIQYPLSKLL